MNLTLRKGKEQVGRTDGTRGKQKPVLSVELIGVGAVQRLPGEVVSSLSLEVCKKRVENSWQESCRTYPSLHSGWEPGEPEDLGGFFHPGARELGMDREEEPVGRGGQCAPGEALCVHGRGLVEKWGGEGKGDSDRLLSCRAGRGHFLAARPVFPGKPGS